MMVVWAFASLLILGAVVLFATGHLSEAPFTSSEYTATARRTYEQHKAPLLNLKQLVTEAAAGAQSTSPGASAVLKPVLEPRSDQPTYHYPPSWIGSDHQKTRRDALAEVFGLLDINNNGEVEPSELLRVAAKRRDLGHKGGTWTDEKNQKLFAKVDHKKDGVIDAEEFSTHYEMLLPRKPKSFEEIIQEFERAARAVRQDAAAL